jgi:transposase-like protein
MTTNENPPRKPARPTVVLAKPKCPYCAHDRYVKQAGAWRVSQLPNGSTSKLFRVKCSSCKQNFNLREITALK